MAIKVWRGDAQAVRQITKLVISEVEVGDKFRLTINRKWIEVIATQATAASVVGQLFLAVDNAEINEFSILTPYSGLDPVTGEAVGDGDFFLIGPADGSPFTVTGSTTNQSGDLGVTVTTVQDGDPGQNEKQQVEILGNPTGGTFTLTLEDQTTSNIQWNDTAANVETALEALSNVSAVSVTGSAGGPWVVDFEGNWANRDVPLLVGDGTNITKGSSDYDVFVQTRTEGDPGVNEVQTIRLPNNTTGGNFTLTFDGQTTAAITYGATAAAVKSALELLSTVDTVYVTKLYDFVYQVEFAGSQAATPQPLIEGNGANLTGAARVVVSEKTAGGPVNEIQRITLNMTDPASVGDPLTLTWQGNSGYTSLDSDLSVMAGRILIALRDGCEVGSGNCGVTGVSRTPKIIDGQQGYELIFDVEFMGSLTGQDVEQIQASLSIVRSGVTIAVETTTHGDPTAINEVQRVRVVPEATGGTYTLRFRSQTTAAIDYDASATDVKSALELLSTVTTVTVTKPAGDQEWEVEFSDPGNEDLPMMVGSGTSLTGGTITVTRDDSVGATDETQRVFIFGNPRGGTFTLTFSGQTTAGIAYNASAQDVKDALELLSNVTTVDVTKLNEADGDGPWDVTFRDPGAQNVDEMTGTSSLSGADIGVATIQGHVEPLDEIQTITLTGSPDGGTWTATFSSQTTGALPWNVSAAGLQSALEQLSSVDVGDIVVTGNQGGPYRVQWVGDESGTNQSEMTGNGASLTSTGSQDITISEHQTPTGPNWFPEANNWENKTTPATIAAPGSGDTAIFDEGDVDCLWGLDNSTVGTLAHLEFKMGYTGNVGLHVRDNEDLLHYEYREDHLKIYATTISIGEGVGTGSPRIKIDSMDGQTTLTMYDSGTGQDEGSRPAVRWKGTHANNKIIMTRGELGVAIEAGESATVESLDQGFLDNVDTDTTVWIGDDVTLGDVNKSGGSLRSYSGCDSFDQLNGDASFWAGNVPRLEARGGLVSWNSTGTLGKYVAVAGATKADPCVISSGGHGLTTGQRVRMIGVGGMIELNGNTYTIEVIDANSFSLVGVDSSAYTTFTSGGCAQLIGSIILSNDAALTFEETHDDKEVAAPILCFGSECTVLDSYQRRQPVAGNNIIDVIEGYDEGSRFQVGRNYRIEQAAIDYPGDL